MLLARGAASQIAPSDPLAMPFRVRLFSTETSVTSRGWDLELPNVCP